MKQICVAAMLAVVASPLFAQSGDISGSTSQYTTLGTTILKVFIGIIGLVFVGVLSWGGVTMATNRQRGLAMVTGGICGALLSGLAFALVSTLTGQSVSTGMLLVPISSFLG